MKAEGMYTIVNETIDVLDGGVSGVSYGGIVEFTPGDTPRGVEKPGIVSLERGFALSILNQVYQFEPQLHYDLEYRVEFSLHPLRRGFRREHTVVWEIERLEALNICRTPTWPNNWSRFIGDKTFGLLIADGLGFSVPSTTVFPRRLPPFRFGRRTGSSETWLRTAPREPVPGRYTTSLGWQDPFRLLDSEDSAGEIASVLAQEGVDAQFAGASVASEAQQLVEGVSGIGDRFMLGEQGPERLPGIVSSSVAEVGRELVSRLGPVKFEWVRDNATTWIVQLHRLPKAFEDVLYAGEATDWHPFNVARGLEALRQLVNGIKGTGDGVVLEGDVGVTSHFGDLLRRARIPARLRSVPSPEA